MEDLNKALLHLVQTYELLRSVIAEELGEYKWQEYEASTELIIPYADLTTYPEDQRRLILSSIMSEKYFFKSYQNTKALLYRLVLLKENSNKYTLVMPFNHCIFDMMSAEIIKLDIMEHYKSLKRFKSKLARKEKPYSDYVKQVLRGPQG